MLTLQLSPFPVIHTGIITLRCITLNDTEALYHLRKDKEVLRYLDREEQSYEEVKTIVEKILDDLANNNSITWVICLSDAPEIPIGMISFWKVDKKNHRAETGYILLPEYWGKGIVSGALNVILDYGFNQMQLHSVEANVNPENHASIAVLEKNGFIKEAHFKENHYFRGTFRDSAIYSKIKDR